MNGANEPNRRVLVIDDNDAIHGDFRKVLSPESELESVLEQAEVQLFGEEMPASETLQAERYDLHTASQGAEGLEKVERALEQGHPYALAFVDIRMPPGWDGVETISRLWQVDPDLQVVICTAYSDYTRGEILDKLGASDSLLILKKPFDNAEVRQLASALTRKWDLGRQARQRMHDLERLVEERTGDIERSKQRLEDALCRLQEAHAQLLQSDKMASIGQLAAGVAHEINNPIGFISSNLNTLDHYVGELNRVLEICDAMLKGDAGATGPTRELTQRALAVRDEVDLDFLMPDIEALIAESIEGTQRVRQIVSDLKDFSHIDNPDLNEEDVNHLLDRTINVAWNELKYRADIVREYGEIPTVLCYGGKLGQVLLNLLVNAAQAIDERGTITVRTGHVDRTVWVEVSDTGCGIPEANLPRIFEPFFTTKEVGTGTGMGLHLAYKIVEAHAGNIRAESVEGQGTTFRIELPMGGPPEAQEQ